MSSPLERRERRAAELMIARAAAAGRDIVAEIASREADTIRPVRPADVRLYGYVREALAR